MCWQCDTGGTHQDYLDHVRKLIATHGWAVVGVERDRIHPPWAYTVGLTPHDRPELVMTGIEPRRATRLLNAAAEYVLQTAIPRPGETMQAGDAPAMEIVRVTDPAAHLLVATELYGKLTWALQLVHPDDRGHFPWCPGYRGGRGGQPVLGVRAASTADPRYAS